ncbi:MAG TPA: hypothetical protein VFT74_16620 [Isosphaeraceae bacterium]|nr:hypothetical protein [Isosphaeraceae bacterium]
MLPTFNAGGLILGLEQVLLLAYLVVLWAGGWGLELLARLHFHRAARYAHHGFSYDPGLDRYECPQGELLTLDTFDDRNKLAIYTAPAATCNACVLKSFCTPHNEGRRVYRSLAAFHETDVGRFHRRLSLTFVSVALVFAVGGLIAFWNTPGEWLQVVASGVGMVILWLDIRDRPDPAENRQADAEKTGLGPA